jgi:hypothetical protein
MSRLSRGFEAPHRQITFNPLYFLNRRSDQRNILGQRRRDHHSIEGIAVMGRQTIQATKERVVERVRTVIEGQGGLSGRRGRLFIDSRPANGVGINRPIDLATKTFAFLKPYADGTKG